MKFSFVLCLYLLVACRSEPPAQSPAAQSSHGQVDSAVSVTRDTAGSGVRADSILDAMREDSPKTVATPDGDTLDLKGGVGFGNDTLHRYALEVYSWNGAGLVRIKRMVTFRADGYPQWSTSIRTVIPPVADSGQAVVLHCQLVNKEDPFVFGSVFDGTYPWRPRHAWRFDTTSATLREIATTEVKCSHMLGYED
jgi:hypothetical protein